MGFGLHSGTTLQLQLLCNSALLHPGVALLLLLVSRSMSAVARVLHVLMCISCRSPQPNRPVTNRGAMAVQPLVLQLQL